MKLLEKWYLVQRMHEINESSITDYNEFNINSNLKLILSYHNTARISLIFKSNFVPVWYLIRSFRTFVVLTIIFNYFKALLCLLPNLPSWIQGDRFLIVKNGFFILIPFCQQFC
jgi:hypothetical protein